MSIKIYTDGAARGNPGRSASGFSIYSGKKLIESKAEYNGICTNNFAEYKAIISALVWLSANMEKPDNLEIELYSDSELVIRQLNGKYKVKSDDMRKLNSEVMKLVQRFSKVAFYNLPREHPEIKRVDRHLNELLDRLPES
jgi:ribonuclease HI